MEEAKQRTTFLALANTINAALHLVRIARRTTRKELVETLKNNFGWLRVTQYNIEQIEKEEVEVDFEKFRDICFALDATVEYGLKVAQRLDQAQTKPPNELLRELIDEIEQTWNRDLD